MSTGADMRAVASAPRPTDRVRPEPEVLGERALSTLERLVLPLERLSANLLPEPLNPLAHTGALAVLTFLVASVSGVLLLAWYSPSVVHAWSSVAAMAGQPWSAGLVRSLHRYSSDACMLFVLMHALRLLLARRFGGPRTLAWLTGVLLVGSLWLVGWLGYWLVWDERARQVALGTAKMMDLLPVFSEPLSRAFLTDEGVSSLLFFVVFFIHMLL
ncbi:MAG: cytochrome b N-terminal domain-containing protein, partial [Myxococcales bacterium]